MEQRKDTPASAEIHPGPGFRIRRDFERPTNDQVKLFQKFAISDISDHLNRMYGIQSSIRCLAGEGRRLIGPACTVKVYPGDNLMVHKALDIAKPGDVVVIDAAASTTNAVLGDIISTKAVHRGIAGFIIDGYVRDVSGIREINLPVYARGETMIGPLHRGPGEINYPICCGSTVVLPGDLVVADTGGIVVIPRTHIDSLYEQLSRYKERTADYLAAVKRGEFSNAWVDRQLENSQCEIN